MMHKFVVNLKWASYNVFRNLSVNRSIRRTIEKFVDKTGMIYFGAVSQSNDEHRLIRGFTASSSHKDNDFSVGTVEDYDISIVYRNDALIDKNDNAIFSNWLIFAIDLKNGKDIPHIFIKANNNEDKHFESLFISNPSFSKIKLGTFEQYPIDFLSRFSVYSSPANIIEVEKLLPADSMKLLAAHLWPYSIEVIDGVIYLYLNDKNITYSNLSSMLNVGLWMARHLDYMINQI